jgi:uncharacterized protein YwgA
MAKKPASTIEGSYIPKIPIKDWILVANLEKDKKNPRNAVTLMNQVFIFSREVLPSMKDEFEFKRTGFGPYSEKVAESVNELILEGMLKVMEGEPTITTRNRYVLTENGAKKAEQIHKKLLKVLKEKIKFTNRAVTYMGSMGTTQYIQSLYPEYVFLKEGGDKFV